MLSTVVELYGTAVYPGFSLISFRSSILKKPGVIIVYNKLGGG